MRAQRTPRRCFALRITSCGALALALKPRWGGEQAAALLFALRTSTPEAQHTIMACIGNAVATQPSLFTPHITAFYLKSADGLSVRLLKLEILTSLANSSATDVNLLLTELQVRAWTSEGGWARWRQELERAVLSRSLCV